VTVNGSGPPLGTADWFEVTLTGAGTTTFSLTLSGESSVAFAVYVDCNGTVVPSYDSDGVDLSGVVPGEYAPLTTAGIYYLKVYGFAGNPTGTFGLALVHS
jgi:hypothetical protein